MSNQPNKGNSYIGTKSPYELTGWLSDVFLAGRSVDLHNAKIAKAELQSSGFTELLIRKTDDDETRGGLLYYLNDEKTEELLKKTNISKIEELVDTAVVGYYTPHPEKGYTIIIGFDLAKKQ